jgi:hypothetical protein
MISAGAHGRGDMRANNVLHSNACLDSGRCRFATCILQYRTRSGVCCIGEMSAVVPPGGAEAAWEESKARQGQGQEKAPRSEVRDGKNPQIHHLLPQRPPRQASRTIQCITIPCHVAWSRLPSLTLSWILHVLAQESHLQPHAPSQSDYCRSPGNQTL